MKRLLPRSFLGQTLLVMAIALLLAQTISAALLYRAAEQRREAGLVNAMAFSVVMARENPRTQRMRARGEARRVARALASETRRMRIPIERLTQDPATIEGRPEPVVRIERVESALRKVLLDQGIEAGDIRAGRRLAGDDSFILQQFDRYPRWRRPGWRERPLLVAAIERPELGIWQVVRIAEPARQRGVLGGILLQTIVIFIVLFSALYFVLRRMTRPLAQLTTRVSDFASSPEQPLALEESGPADMRRLIAAHNAMEARIAALLDEKDVMLGAIGHDLKTPLAALRVRIESVPDMAQREQMALGIEEITRSLDDILNLARIGRANEELQRTDLTSLLASLGEEYEDMGKPVVLADGPKVVAKVRINWLRRAVRNLVDNALRYGGNAQISVVETDGDALIQIEDDGPGIEDDRIAELLAPFARGEKSRNRATGGTGLGLTLAKAVAEQHGGSLELANRAEGGLRAVIRLPRGERR